MLARLDDVEIRVQMEIARVAVEEGAEALARFVGGAYAADGLCAALAYLVGDRTDLHVGEIRLDFALRVGTAGQ